MLTYQINETCKLKNQYFRIVDEESNGLLYENTYGRKSSHHTSALSFSLPSNGNVTGPSIPLP